MDVEQLRRERDELAETLEDLMDHQNGPPLPTYEKRWTEIMERGRKLIDTLTHAHDRLKGCTCRAYCPASCKGECGCKVCREAWADDQSFPD
jgi:hypothetical protein